MVRWMCDVKVKDRVSSKESRDRLGIDDIILILGYSKTSCDGMSMCCEKKTLTGRKDIIMEYEVEGSIDQRGLRERFCKKRLQTRKLNREDATDCSRWKKLTKVG